MNENCLMRIKSRIAMNTSETTMQRIPVRNIRHAAETFPVFTAAASERHDTRTYTNTAAERILLALSIGVFFRKQKKKIENIAAAIMSAKGEIPLFACIA